LLRLLLLCDQVQRTRQFILRQTYKTSGLDASFRGKSRLGSGSITLRWFKLAHICLQVTSPHKGDKDESTNKCLYRKNTIEYFYLKYVLNTEGEARNLSAN